MLDKEKESQKPKEVPAPHPEVKQQSSPPPSPPKPVEKHADSQPNEDDSGNWFTASLKKFRNLKKSMFSFLSFLPQTGTEGGVLPEDFDFAELTNQDKLSLFDNILNEEGVDVRIS